MKKTLSVFCIVIIMAISCTQRENKSFTKADEAIAPKFSADVPENILTPDKVETNYLGSA